MAHEPQSSLPKDVGLKADVMQSAGASDDGLQRSLFSFLGEDVAPAPPAAPARKGDIGGNKKALHEERPLDKPVNDDWIAGEIAPGVWRLDPQTFKNLMHGTMQDPSAFFGEIKTTPSFDARLVAMGNPSAAFFSDDQEVADLFSSPRARPQSGNSVGRVYTADIDAKRPMLIEHDAVKHSQDKALADCAQAFSEGRIDDAEYKLCVKELTDMQQQFMPSGRPREDLYSLAARYSPDLIVSVEQFMPEDAPQRHYIALDDNAIKLKEVRAGGDSPKRQRKSIMSYMPAPSGADLQAKREWARPIAAQSSFRARS